MKAVIYARYSSDLQSKASIEDQVRVCRERADKMDFEVVDVFTDPALSGSRLQNRPSIQKLLERARAPGSFDVVITEALDRLSRDQEDIAGLFKRLAHLDIRIHTLSEGDINELHVGLKGTMNALFLKDLANKVRRGQRGRAEASRAAGGLSYGYRVLREIGANGEVERGRREIDPEAARIIRRIFEEYVAGRSPRAIAADLNREGVPSPRGGLLEREHHQWKSKATPRYPAKHALCRQDGVRSTLISKGPRHWISPTPSSAAGQVGSRRCTRVAYCLRGAMAGSTDHADAPHRKAIARGSTAAALVERIDTLWAVWRRLHHEIERSTWLRRPSRKWDLQQQPDCSSNGTGEPSAGRAQGASIDPKPFRGVREAVSRDI